MRVPLLLYGDGEAEVEGGVRFASRRCKIHCCGYCLARMTVIGSVELGLYLLAYTRREEPLCYWCHVPITGFLSVYYTDGSRCAYARSGVAASVRVPVLVPVALRQGNLGGSSPPQV